MSQKLKNPIFYNKASSKMLGWMPIWFGCNDFDDELIENIKKFQKSKSPFLTVDGLCGEETFRFINNDIKSNLSIFKNFYEEREKKLFKKNNNIMINETRYFEISDKIKFIGMYSDKSMVASPEHFRTSINREINMIVVHHDACLNSKTCYNILEKRNLSIHFMINYDGTVYQSCYLDNIAQHAGKLNDVSIGIEVCNPVESKYNKYYTSLGLPPRPIIKSQKIHNTTYRNIMGLYPGQIESLKILLETLCNNYVIPKQTPINKDGTPIMTLHKPAIEKQYEGIIAHYHINPEKWDIAGINLVELIKDI